MNFTNEGGMDGTYRLLKNIMGLWLVQECSRSFAKAGGSGDYAALVQPYSRRVTISPTNGRYSPSSG